METGIDKEKLLYYRNLIVKHLSDPIKMRLAVVSAALIIGLGAVYVPFSKRLAKQQAQLEKQTAKANAIRDVENLRKQINLYKDRIPKISATNGWVQYILGGIRKNHVKLRDMSTRQPRKVASYKALVMEVEMEGTYPNLKKFVEWLEQSDRLLRIDGIRFKKRQDCLLMKVVVLGLVRGNATKNR